MQGGRRCDIVLDKNQLGLDDFLSTAADAVHLAHPFQLIFSFQGFGHTLCILHLPDNKGKLLVEKVVIHSASGGRTICRQQKIDIYFNFIGDTFPSQIEINHDDVKKITEQQIAKRKKYQKTSGENRKKKRAALREAAKTDPQAAAEYEALLQKNRERCRQYAQKKKLAQQELVDKTALQFEPTDELKGESA